MILTNGDEWWRKIFSHPLICANLNSKLFLFHVFLALRTLVIKGKNNKQLCSHVSSKYGPISIGWKEQLHWFFHFFSTDTFSVLGHTFQHLKSLTGPNVPSPDAICLWSVRLITRWGAGSREHCYQPIMHCVRDGTNDSQQATRSIIIKAVCFSLAS